MPTINVNDAYVLNETGAEVDKVTGLFTKDESTTSGEKSQARYNIGAGGSNRNLLDNAYFVGGGSQLGDGVFPINQRAQTSYTGGVVGFDRWIVDAGNFTATLQSNGVRVVTSALYSGLSQNIPAYKLENGETYTYSIVVDGVLHTATFVANNDGNWANIYYGDDWYVPYRFTNGVWSFKVINAMAAFDHIISKVKLEKGTVSTLANDPPPDFGEELRKCQRRLFIHDFANGDIIASGFAVSASYSVCSLVLPVSMASDGTLTGTVTANPLIYGGGTGEQVSSFSVSAVKGNYAKIGVATTVMPANNSITLYANTNIRLTISKEL